MVIKMKKITALALALLMVFSFAACSEDPTEVMFKEFTDASYSTLSSNIKVETKMVTALGELNSTVETVFNPNGSVTLTYSIENFNEDVTSPEPKVTKTGTVTYKDGSYTGDAEGVLEGTVTSVKLNLDPEKMDYTVSGGVLSAVIKAENVSSVLGVEIPADVSIALTKGDKKITSLTMNYTLPDGTVTVICTFN